jgi:hypothetical protein
MNASQRREWLDGTAACLKLRVGKLRGRLAKLDALDGGGRWEAAFSPSGELSLVRLRYFGRGAGLEAWAAEAAALFGIAGAPRGLRPASAGLPWLTLDWDGRADRLRRWGVLGRRPGVRADSAWLQEPGGPWRRARFEEAAFSSRTFPRGRLNKELSAFHALCPIASVRLEWEAGADGAWRPARRWALRLRKPLAWPLWLRLDLAAVFAERGSQLSLLALDRKVSELAYEGDVLWSYFGC